jgi:putative ATP-binding cassette transporter
MDGFFSSIPLVRLLRSGSNRFNANMVGVVALAGLSNAGLLAIINSAANDVNGPESGRMLATFAVTIAVYIMTQRQILFVAISEIEQLLDHIRVRVADRIRRSELESLDHVGRSEIFGIVSRETQNISQAASTVVNALQSLMMVLFSIIYIAILSRTALVIVGGLVWIALTMHFRRSAELSYLLTEAKRQEDNFLGALTHLLDGFKEVRMNRARSSDLFKHLREISDAVSNVKTRAGMRFASHYVIMQAMLYGLLGAIVFVLPRVSPAYSQDVLKLTVAILFIIGPLGAIVATIPQYSTANVAAENIFRLEATLEKSSARDKNGRADAEPSEAFSAIDFRHVVFQYEERGHNSAFRIGPINLTVPKGEILFIVGGNGSGKSTLLRTLTGLYPPSTGSVLINNTLVTPENVTWYRSHFSPIFSDYHLFDRLYGLKEVQPERLTELMKLMQIEDKTSFENGGFTNLELSSGQRKRLALIVALLEDRPIMVLDEWAADQDPGFRQFFYETILADLKRQGKTVIAATHDDRYFGVADRVLKMEYGELTVLETSNSRK